MAPMGVIFLANRGTLTRPTLYESIRQRLGKEPGCYDVQTCPSRARTRTIEARVVPEEFLSRAYPVDDARLTIGFTYPESVDYEYYVIEWIEADRDFGLGWHQDETHPDLGECHFQLDHAGSTVDRVGARFVDDHPLEVLETRLGQLRSVLPQLVWDSDEPELPERGVPAP